MVEWVQHSAAVIYLVRVTGSSATSFTFFCLTGPVSGLSFAFILLYEVSHCYNTFYCVQICHRVVNRKCHLFITLRSANDYVHIDHGCE